MGVLQRPGSPDLLTLLHLGELPALLLFVRCFRSNPLGPMLAFRQTSFNACTDMKAVIRPKAASAQTHAWWIFVLDPMNLVAAQGVFNVFIGAMLVSHLSEYATSINSTRIAGIRKHGSHTFCILCVSREMRCNLHER